MKPYLYFDGLCDLVITVTNIPIFSPKLPILRQKTYEISKSPKIPASGLKAIPSVPIIPVPRPLN